MRRLVFTFQFVDFLHFKLLPELIHPASLLIPYLRYMPFFGLSPRNTCCTFPLTTGVWSVCGVGPQGRGRGPTTNFIEKMMIGRSVGWSVWDTVTMKKKVQQYDDEDIYERPTNKSIAVV